MSVSQGFCEQCIVFSEHHVHEQRADWMDDESWGKRIIVMFECSC